MKSTKMPLYTNLPVLTEVVYMLDFSTQAQLDFLGWVRRAIRIDGRSHEELPRIDKKPARNLEVRYRRLGKHFRGRTSNSEPVSLRREDIPGERVESDCAGEISTLPAHEFRGRRMHDATEHLAERVHPELLMRQYVLPSASELMGP